MNNKVKAAGFVVLCSIGLFCNIPASAQQKGWGESNKLEDAEIVVEKNRVNQLPEANRNYEKFKIAPPEKKPNQVTYRFADYRLNDLKLSLPIRVLTIKPEELPQLYGNYVKVGVGNYGTSYLKGYFHNKRNDAASYGANVSHVSSLGGPVKNSDVSNSAINLKGEMFSRNVTFGGKLAYQHDRYNFYGYNHGIEEVDKDTIKQAFNRVGGLVYLNSKNAKSPIKFNASLGFDYLADRYDARESNIKIGFGSGYALDKTAAVNVDGDVSFITYKNDYTQSRTYFRLKPAYVKTTDLLQLTLGATLGLTNDTLSTARTFNFYPNVRVAFELVDDRLQVFGGVGGDLERVTLYDLTQENPFLQQNVAVADINKVLDFYGGFTGSLSSNFKFSGKAAYQSFRNLYFYNNSPLDSAKFDLVYDNGTTKVINLSGELSYNKSERLRMGVKADYNAYTTDELAKPFHRPAVQANVFGSYNHNDKIFFHSELYYISSTFGMVNRKKPNNLVNEVLKETDSIVDLNLKADYRFTDKFSTFVMLNNVLGRKYERFVNYPNKGIQAIAGLSYTF